MTGSEGRPRKGSQSRRASGRRTSSRGRGEGLTRRRLAVRGARPRPLRGVRQSPGWRSGRRRPSLSFRAAPARLPPMEKSCRVHPSRLPAPSSPPASLACQRLPTITYCLCASNLRGARRCGGRGLLLLLQGILSRHPLPGLGSSLHFERASPPFCSPRALSLSLVLKCFTVLLFCGAFGCLGRRQWETDERPGTLTFLGRPSVDFYCLLRLLKKSKKQKNCTGFKKLGCEYVATSTFSP